MLRTAVLNINLTPMMEYDNEAGMYILYYKEFPQAVAAGKTEDEAEINLAYLVQDVWTKRQDESKEFLLKNYKDNISIQPSSSVK